MTPHDLYLEVGQRRTFAGAMRWPGWCRGGRNEGAALAALLAAAPRYAAALADSPLGFVPPLTRDDFVVVERWAGTTTTDFGAPDGTPAIDEEPFDEAELARSLLLLDACWRAWDLAVAAAEGRTLRTGPRGGGREREAIRAHVVESGESYLRKLGWEAAGKAPSALAARQQRLRHAIGEGLAAAQRGEIAPTGPRGGQRWNARQFLRRTAWHILDHAWEIEDRIA
ncbi:MAG: hypothetical protein KDD73_00310 [Anaerolineales bacterium]|nr:hypothetical protein [Anaerolineales bacterium]MCB9127928.1 hypothetical protein [Ardenticatenales bacterium]